MSAKKPQYKLTPLRNSARCSKPFVSPFAAPNTHPKENKKQNTAGQRRSLSSLTSPLSEPNRPFKKLKLSQPSFDSPKTSKGEQKGAVTKKSLYNLKKRIFQLTQEVNSMKMKLINSEKHNPQELRETIAKWKTGCQEALERLESDSKSRSQDNVDIPQILNSMNIPLELVGYSVEECGFV